MALPPAAPGPNPKFPPQTHPAPEPHSPRSLQFPPPLLQPTSPLPTTPAIPMSVREQLDGMSEERFLSIYQSLEHQGFGPFDAKVAESLRFRPQAIRKLPMEKRAKRAKQILQKAPSTELAYELFGTYLLKHHQALVTGLLDGTGVQHEDGMIEDLDASPPNAEKIAPTLEALENDFAPEDVLLYLAMCVEQWPDVTPFTEAYTARQTP